MPSSSGTSNSNSSHPLSDPSLPDDLAELGSQLAADADRLAASFPPGKPSGIVVHTARTNTAQTVLMTAAGSLILVLVASVVGGVVMSRNWLPKNSEVRRGALGAPVALEMSPNATPEPDETAKSSLMAPESSTISLVELSSPEIEALLDLWEREPNDTPGIAF